MSIPGTEGYPKTNVINHLEELRRRILYALSFLVFFSVIAFLRVDYLLKWVKAPISGVIDELIFISPTEAFVSAIKVSILTGFILAFPFILFQAWFFLAPGLNEGIRSRIRVWLFFGLILFFFGIAFSYFLALPVALNFLISFGSNIATAKIALGAYISFFTALVLIGGIIFEIPICMGILADAGIVKAAALKKKRHIALIAILVFSAIITPTQDILNMLLFACPMMILYEIGLIIISRIEKQRK